MLVVDLESSENPSLLTSSLWILCSNLKRSGFRSYDMIIFWVVVMVMSGSKLKNISVKNLILFLIHDVSGSISEDTTVVILIG